ncbi:MAG: MFS transporter [Pyrinomonadaceae bacterium]
MSATATNIVSAPESLPRARGGRLALTASYCAALVALGLTTGSLGPTLPGLAAQTHARISSIGLLLTARSLGFLLINLRAGRLYDRGAGHRLMAVALVCMAVLMAVAPVPTQLWLLTLVMLGLGAGEGLLDMGGNTLLTWAHDSRRVGSALNAAHLGYAVGATVAPLIVARTITHGTNAAYWALAPLVLLPAVWLLYLPSPPPRLVAQTDEPAAQARPRLVLLLALFLALYVGAEVAFGGWIATYALARRWSDAAGAALLTSAFYGALMLGRLFAIPLAARLRPRTILSTALCGCLFSLVLLLTGAHALVWPGAFGVGLFMAAIFPTLLAFAGRHMHMTGRITGRLLVGASLGGMSVPWLVGQLFEYEGPRAGMLLIALVLLVALGLFAATLALLRRPAEKFL